MLSPVPAVSSASSVTSLKPATVGVETLIALIAAMPDGDGDLALSRAVNVSVEGKLNMLLIAARERMIDSLFAVIDAVSEGLNLPQEQGETNSAYALRLADAVENLSKPQLASLQQQLTARGQTLPLPQIAAALKDPTSQAAAQVVAYMEVVRYKDRDLATKAVVSSYGQNAGATEEETAVPQQPTQAQAKPAAVPSTPITTPANSNNIAQAVPAAPQPLDDPEAAAALLAAVVVEAAEVEQAAQIIPNPGADEADAGGNTAAEAENDAATAQASLKAATGTVEEKPQTATAGSTALAAGNDTKALPADIEARLKVVVKLAIDAAGPEILDIMADSERLSETVVAQALIADMLDDQDLATALMPADATDETQGRQLAAQGQAAAGTSLEASVEDTPSIVRLFVPVAAGAALPLPAAMPAVAQPPLPLGVPFAVGQYLPADEPKTEERQLAVDRVDPIDGEARGGNHQQQASDQETEDEQDGGAEAATEIAEEPTRATEAQSSPTAAPQPVLAKSESLALPRPQSAASPVVDLYQRMADWQ